MMINSITTQMPSGKRKRDAAFFQSLVDYYYEKRGPQLRFWESVAKEYHQSSWYGKTDREQLDEVKPGRVYSLVHTTESMVFNRRPKIFLECWTSKISVEETNVLERLLNAEWSYDYRLVREIKLAVRDCIKTGIGVVLTSYDAEFEPRAIEKAAKKRRDALAGGAPVDTELTNLIDDTPDVEYKETYEHMVSDKINTRRISPFDFLADPDASSLDDAKWVGRRIMANIEDVKADKMLSNTGSLVATSQPKSGFKRKNKKSSDPYQYVELYEIWERMVGGGWRMVVIARDHKEILRTIENPFWIGCPIRLLRWNEDGEDIFAQSDILPAWPMILAERILSTKVLDGYSREHMDTTFYDKNLGVNEEQLNAVGNPEVGKYVEVKSANNRPLRDGLFKLPKDAKSPEALALLQYIERQFQISSGMSQNQMGQSMKSETSATEASEVAAYAKARGNHKYMSVEEFVSQVSCDRIGMMAQFYKTDRVFRFGGMESARVWANIAWTKEDFIVGLRLRVEPGSLRPVNDEGRAQQLMQFMQTFSQVPALANRIDMREFAKRVFAAMGFHDGDALMLTDEIMKQQEAAALEAQAKSAEIDGAGGLQQAQMKIQGDAQKQQMQMQGQQAQMQAQQEMQGQQQAADMEMLLQQQMMQGAEQ